MYQSIAPGFAFFTLAIILGALLGGRGVGRLLVVGSERNLGIDRLAAHAADQGLEWGAHGVLGGHRFVCRISRSEHVFIGSALLR